MRILLDAVTEVGERTGHILLAERDLAWLGRWRAAGMRKGRRTGPADDVAGFDAVVTDRDDGVSELIAHAAVAGVPVVTWIDAPPVPPGRATAPVVTGANVGAALVAALTAHPNASPGEGEEVTTAWTEPGRPARRGSAVAFPEPVGTVWATERPNGALVALRDDEWGGASVLVEGAGGRRIVGASDHAAHLEALVLAGVTLLAAKGQYPSERVSAASADIELLRTLEELELDIAVWRSPS